MNSIFEKRFSFCLDFTIFTIHKKISPHMVLLLWVDGMQCNVTLIVRLKVGLVIFYGHQKIGGWQQWWVAQCLKHNQKSLVKVKQCSITYRITRHGCPIFLPLRETIEESAKRRHLWQYWAKRGAIRCPECNADSSIGSRGC